MGRSIARRAAVCVSVLALTLAAPMPAPAGGACDTEIVVRGSYTATGPWAPSPETLTCPVVGDHLDARLLPPGVSAVEILYLVDQGLDSLDAEVFGLGFERGGSTPPVTLTREIDEVSGQALYRSPSLQLVKGRTGSGCMTIVVRAPDDSVLATESYRTADGSDECV